jgi:hypothetical protein
VRPVSIQKTATARSPSTSQLYWTRIASSGTMSAAGTHVPTWRRAEEGMTSPGYEAARGRADNLGYIAQLRPAFWLVAMALGRG